MQSIFSLTVVALVGFSPQQPDTKTRFEDLATQLKIFPTGEFVYGRGEQLRQIPKEWTAPWLKVLAAISTGKDDARDLIGLLGHKDPRVRTLALAALFQREDAKLLPNLVAMMQDQEMTVPNLEIRRAQSIGGKLLPQDFHEQTVGRVAQVLVTYWMQAAGYEAKDFETYWAARKDRKFCASWYLMRLYRAGQATSAFDKKRAPLIIAMRKEVDALPARDRDWTLLWVAAHHLHASNPEPGSIWATPEERLAAAKRLGPDRLMDLILQKDISTDPDLAAKDNKSRGRDDLILWVLRNAGKLLRAQDAPAILAAEQTLRDRPPWCAIAAAELQPESARKWLREAMGRFAGKYAYLAEHRAELAAAMWRIVGDSEMDYLADWLYGEKVDQNAHTPATDVFLDGIKGARAPADRKLVARLVTDKRLDKLDYQSLRALIQVAGGWTKEPIIPQRDLYPNWERGGLAPESPKDLEVLAEWRAKLKKSVAEWNP
jgi:hypothetical protein